MGKWQALYALTPKKEAMLDTLKALSTHLKH